MTYIEHPNKKALDYLIDHEREIKRIFGHKYGRNRADDIYQDVASKILLQQKTIEHPQAWIYRVGEREQLSYVRRKINQSEELPSVLYADDKPPEDILTVKKIMSNLANKRETVELFYFDGLKSHEIADKLEEPEGTIKARLHRTREEMKAYFR